MNTSMPRSKGSSEKLKLIIADDHNLFRKGMASILEGYEDIGTVLEAGDGEQLLQLVEEQKPDVVLLDVKMPKLSGLAAMPILYKKYPEVKVLALSMHAEPSYISTLINEGANGYLLKDADIKEVLEAIRTVASGENYVNKLVADALMEQSRPKRVSDSLSELTVCINQQEVMLLKLIVEQNTSSQIAAKLNLGVRTIETYRRRLMKKIGVKNAAGLVAFAIEHKIVDK